MKGDPQGSLKLADQGIRADAKDPWPYYDKGMALATRIDRTGRAVVWSGHRELAELYHEQLTGYGLTMAPLEQ